MTAVHAELTKEAGRITLDLLKHACKYWIRRHPLLGACIHRHYSADKRFILNMPRHFVHMRDKSELLKFNNVEIIRTTNDVDYDRVWKDLVEQELNTPLDTCRGPLWRLKVLEQHLEHDKVSDDIEQQQQHTRYTFVFMFNHTITDGKNNVIFIELLNILGALIGPSAHSQCVEMCETVDSPHTLDHYIKRFVAAGAICPRPDQQVADDVAPERTPPPTRRLGNRVNGSQTKFACFRLSSSTLRRLLAKIKEKTNGAGKLTGFVEAVLCLAYKRTLLKYGEERSAALPFQYALLCGARDKLNIGLARMGCFSTFLMVRLPSDELNALSSVWTVAEKQTRAIHQRLNNNEDIDMSLAASEASNNNTESLVDGHSIADLCAGLASHVNISFALSSTGILANTRSELVKAKQLYCVVPTRECGPVRLFVRINTLDEHLHVTVSYNERFYSTQFVGDLNLSMQAIINELIVV